MFRRHDPDLYRSRILVTLPERPERAVGELVELMALPETRAKAAAVLEQHYADTAEHAKRAEAIEVMIATARSKDDRLTLYKRLADVHEALRRFRQVLAEGRHAAYPAGRPAVT